MSEPRIGTDTMTVRELLTTTMNELVSVQSALNMEPTPIENPDGPYTSDRDEWVRHAYAHLEGVHETLRVLERKLRKAGLVL